LGVFVGVAALWLAGAFQPAELWIYDHLVSWRAGAGKDDPRIALVLLTDSDIAKYDYPLRDVQLAKLLTILEQDHPRAIGLDLYRDLPEPRDGSGLPQLNAVLAQNFNIIPIFLYASKDKPFAIAPPALLSGSPDRIGFNNFQADYRTIRRGFVSLPGGYESLAWQMAYLYLAADGIMPGSEGGLMRLGKSTFPKFTGNEGGYTGTVATGYQLLFDFKGPRSFATYTVDDVLTGHAAGAFSNKIVLIGGSSESAGDFLTTPLGDHQQEPGVLIHAQTVNQYLRAALEGDAPTAGVALSWEIVLLFGWCAVATAAGYYCQSFWSFTGALTACLAFLFGLSALLFLHNVWLASAAPALAVLLAAVGAKAITAHMETRHRSELMHLFSRHVSSEVAKSLWERREEFIEGNRPRAQKLTATVLFTDLKNYSSISEKLPPDELMTWINDCLGAQARHVDSNGGIINKYIGDSIMAVFGVPSPRTTIDAIRLDAIHAVQCAWEMKGEIQRLNDAWQARGLGRVGLRIGIYTGELMAGTVGHADRLEYTVIGDSVNTASRLESVDKEATRPEDAECRILIGEPTFDLVKDSFEVELMGTTQLKGQQRLTPYYRVVGPR
jgi:adenylate cyclase